MFALWDVLCTRHNISMFCGINHTNVKLSNLHSLLSCTRQYILERHHFLTPRKRWFSPGTMWLTHKVPWVPHDWLNYFQIATTCSSSFFFLLLPPLSPFFQLSSLSPSPSATASLSWPNSCLASGCQGWSYDKRQAVLHQFNHFFSPACPGR